MQKLKKTRRKHKTKQKETEKKHKNLKENKKNRNTGFPAHEPPRINRTNYSQSFVGWIFCISVFFCCSLSVSVVFMFLSVVFLFSHSIFKLSHLQSKNTYNNKTTLKKIKGKYNKKKEISQPDP